MNDIVASPPSGQPGSFLPGSPHAIGPHGVKHPFPSFSRRLPLAISGRLAAAAAILAGTFCLSPASAETLARRGMVAAAHPLAVDAGVRVLRDGGNAMDAAVATAFALGVAEPYASGIGGGGFLLHYDAATGEVTAYDYREVAPSSLDESHYRQAGRIRPNLMRFGGMAVGVPGMLHGLHTAHGRHGRLDFGRLLDPAIRHAEDGFPVCEELAGHISDKMELLQENEAAAAVFLEEGILPLATGSLLIQKDLANTLKKIRESGLEAIYGEEAASRIAEAVRQTGGIMTAGDVMGFQTRDGTVIRSFYRGYEILSKGPPSGGGLAMLQTLRLMEGFPVAEWGPRHPARAALFIEASGLASRSMDANVADPRCAAIDLEELLSDSWVAAGREAMRISRMLENGGETCCPGEDSSGSTTHLSVVDEEGNMVALTQTINHFFGSGVVVPGMGILLNNEMDDFTFREGSVNLPEAGKVPRSNMAPSLVLKEGRPVATLGTPGGTRIPAALTQIMVNKIDFGMSLAEAIDAPRIFFDAPRGRVAFENRDMAPLLRDALRLLGDPSEIELMERAAFDRYFGGAQGVWIHQDEDGNRILAGAADPRRGGVARGY